MASIIDIVKLIAKLKPSVVKKNKNKSYSLSERPMKLAVICVKWGNKFSADYVNKLYNMVSRNLTIPHRFVCLTDNPDDLAAGIETKKLQLNFEYCWTKLELFKDGNFAEEELCLYLDLDIVITGNIDDLVTFKTDEQFIGLYDWYSTRNPFFNSSVMRFYGNSATKIINALIKKLEDGQVRWDREYDKYLGSLDKVVLWEGNTRYGSDQEWISRLVYPKKELKRHCFPDPWILSYKKHGRERLPRGCKIMVFHGFPKPHETDNDYVKEHWR